MKPHAAPHACKIPLASLVARGCIPSTIQRTLKKVSHMRASLILLATSLALVLPGLSLAQDISDDRIKALIAQSLRENPELVLEALQTLEARQADAQAAAAAAVLTTERAVLERDPNAPVLGNPDGDVTVIEFFD